jgi:hydrogenase expression/formation protein HypC
MCVEIPVKIIEVGADGLGRALCERGPITVNLSMIGGTRPGDWVIVHAGYAIQKVDQAEAETTLDLIAEITSMDPEA